MILLFTARSNLTMGDREFRDYEKKLRRTPKKNSSEASSKSTTSTSSENVIVASSTSIDETSLENVEPSSVFSRSHPPAKMNDQVSMLLNVSSLLMLLKKINVKLFQAILIVVTPEYNQVE
jgi:hypothetical protein